MILERVAFTPGFQFFPFHRHLSLFNEAFMNSFIIPLKQLLSKPMLISEMSFPIAHLMRSSCITLHGPLSAIPVSFRETILSGSSYHLSGGFLVWLMTGCCSSTQSVNVDMPQEHDLEISSHIQLPHCRGDLPVTWFYSRQYSSTWVPNVLSNLTCLQINPDFPLQMFPSKCQFYLSTCSGQKLQRHPWCFSFSCNKLGKNKLFISHGIKGILLDFFFVFSQTHKNGMHAISAFLIFSCHLKCMVFSLRKI